jgi:hypothetical protein
MQNTDYMQVSFYTWIMLLKKIAQIEDKIAI